MSAIKVTPILHGYLDYNVEFAGIRMTYTINRPHIVSQSTWENFLKGSVNKLKFLKYGGENKVRLKRNPEEKNISFRVSSYGEGGGEVDFIISEKLFMPTLKESIDLMIAADIWKRE